jgi:hypothetical protein
MVLDGKNVKRNLFVLTVRMIIKYAIFARMRIEHNGQIVQNVMAMVRLQKKVDSNTI